MNKLSRFNRYNRKLKMIEAETALIRSQIQQRQHRINAAHVTTITGGSKSPGGLSSSGITRLFDHTQLRHNVRDAMFDSDVGRGVAIRFADSIAGNILKLKLEPDVSILGKGTDGSALEKLAHEVSSRFHLWMVSKDASLNGINNGYQNQWLYSFLQQRDNDIFVKLSYNRTDKSLISPLQMQFIDPDQLAGNCYTATDGVSQDFNHGIKYDSKGREVSYSFITINKDGGYREVEIPRVGRRSGRRYIIHGFRPEYAGQRQGYPLYTHLLQEFEDITTLKASHVQKAINQSSWGFYTKPSKNAPASGGIADYSRESVEVVKDFLNASEVDNMGQDELNAFTANIMNEFTIRQPGTLWNTTLTAGEDMKAVEQTAPADKFAEFVDSLVSYLTASSGMPIEVLKMKFGQNYSASRATLVLFWRIVNMWRQEMAYDFLNVLVEMWLSEEIALGRINLPGWKDPVLRAAWLSCRWVGDSMPNIDPKKEAEAAKLRVELGQETLDDGALTNNGSNGETNRLKLRRELEELPIPPWGKNYAE